MAIHFSRDRLHVGYRACDWTDVWYKPIGNLDDERGAEIALFHCKHGDAGPREPMEGEVLWHPSFDPNSFSARLKRERKILQCRFLVDAWRYLAEPDAAKIQQLEDDLEDSKNRRWQSWFDHAKIWKKRQLKRRRRYAAKAEGQEVHESDYESDDSAYDGGFEREARERKRERSSEPMGPPRSTPVSKGHARDTSQSTARPEKKQRSSGAGSSPASGAPNGVNGTSGDGIHPTTELPTKGPGFTSHIPPTKPTGTPMRSWDFNHLRTPIVGPASGRLYGFPPHSAPPSLFIPETKRDLNGGLGEDEALGEAMRRSMEPDPWASRQRLLKLTARLQRNNGQICDEDEEDEGLDEGEDEEEEDEEDVGLDADMGFDTDFSKNVSGNGDDEDEDEEEE